MNITNWTRERVTSPAAQEEMVLSFDESRATRVLIVPALLEEANKLRRFTTSVMRALDEADIDSALPDLPGCNESAAPLHMQTLAGWRSDLSAFANQFEATHVLSVRAGALIAPQSLPGWQYAPLDGGKLLSGLLRARVIASRELGTEEDRDRLAKRGRDEGLTLAGWNIGAEMYRELEEARAVPSEHARIDASDLGGAGLWLRAEPDEDAEQSDALARLVAQAVASGKDAPQ